VLLVSDGLYSHKTLHLNAMGAAIPHMLQLALSLPEILPYSEDDIRTEVLTGSVEVQDEVIPEDEDQDISIRTRGKSTLSVVITIGDGVDEGPRSGKGKKKPKGHSGHTSAQSRGQQTINAGQKQKAGPSAVETVVFREEDID
jgi:ribonuclease P/MRP protein subunit RPP20